MNLPGEVWIVSGLAGLRKLRGFLTTMQKWAAGIVGQVSLKA